MRLDAVKAMRKWAILGHQRQHAALDRVAHSVPSLKHTRAGQHGVVDPGRRPKDLELSTLAEMVDYRVVPNLVLGHGGVQRKGFQQPFSEACRRYVALADERPTPFHQQLAPLGLVDALVVDGKRDSRVHGVARGDGGGGSWWWWSLEMDRGWRWWGWRVRWKG